MRNQLPRPAACVDTARPNEREEAVRLLFQHLPPHEAEPRITNALDLLRRGELDSQGLFVVRDSQTLLGAMVCQLIPGASGLVWPPQVRKHRDRRLFEDQLVLRAGTWLQRHGVKIAQALLSPEDIALSAPLTRNGFQQITNLWYMRCQFNAVSTSPKSHVKLSYQTYGTCNSTIFQQTLLQTYEGSQDCPEVNGIRAIEEIIAGHKAQGKYDPQRWWLAWADERPVAVLLIASVAEFRSWDLAYLGVVPEARRRGIGRELMMKARWDACQAQQTQLTLAVDSRNQPAWNLYRSLGFEPYDRRQVYLAVFSG